MAELTITKENFKSEVLDADKPVLLDFWANWCGPCRMLAPVIAEIAEDCADTVKVGKVNVDEEPELAEAFRVESIPMVVVVKEGKVLRAAVGYQPKESILSLFQ